MGKYGHEVLQSAKDLDPAWYCERALMAYQLQVLPRKKRRHGTSSQEPRHNLQLRDLKLDEIRVAGPAAEAQCCRPVPFSLNEALRPISVALRYAKGAVLFFEGEKTAGIFLVGTGQVRLSASAADGRSLLVRRAEPGEIVGLPAAVSGKASEVTAEALDEVTCNFVAREPLLQFLRQHGEAALQTTQIVTGFYQSILLQVRNLGLSSSTAEKLARFLLDLPLQENRECIALATHKEIAGMIGASRETVTRMFGRFKQEQLLEIDPKGMRITNRAALQRMLAE